MRIDLPQCSFKLCKKCFDGNCTGDENNRLDCKEFKNGGWIAVSERLPEEEKYYNVTIKLENENYCEFCLFDLTYQKFYFVAEGKVSENQDWKEEATNVIAWMPLPEPFTEVER